MKFTDLFQPGWNWLALAVVLASGGARLHAEAGQPVTIENQYVKYVLGLDGSNSAFIDKQSGTDYCDHQRGAKFAKLKKAGKEYAATSATYAVGKLQVQFGESGVTAEIGVGIEKRYFTFEVLSVSDAAVDELVFLDVPLNSPGSLARTIRILLRKSCFL